jgi:hypothetical protein
VWHHFANCMYSPVACIIHLFYLCWPPPGRVEPLGRALPSLKLTITEPPTPTQSPPCLPTSSTPTAPSTWPRPHCSTTSSQPLVHHLTFEPSLPTTLSLRINARGQSEHASDTATDEVLFFCAPHAPSHVSPRDKCFPMCSHPMATHPC